jgi:hypothetical protein
MTRSLPDVIQVYWIIILFIQQYTMSIFVMRCVSIIEWYEY